MPAFLQVLEYLASIRSTHFFQSVGGFIQEGKTRFNDRRADGGDDGGSLGSYALEESSAEGLRTGLVSSS